MPLYNPPAQTGYTPGGTDVAVADGGTGASTAADARTNLGVPAGSGTSTGSNTGDQSLAALVVGPASAVADHLAVFDGTTGKLVKDGGAIPSAGVGGSTGSTDNRVLRADGTGGATVQSSDVSLADAGGGIVQMSVSGNAFDIGTTSGNNLRLIQNGSAIVTINAAVGISDSSGSGGTLAIKAATTTGAIYAFTSELTSGFGRAAANTPAIYVSGTEVGRFDASATATNTRFLLYDVDSGTLKRVSVGAADSGGTGFKVLRIPN